MHVVLRNIASISSKDSGADAMEFLYVGEMFPWYYWGIETYEHDVIIIKYLKGYLTLHYQYSYQI